MSGGNLVSGETYILSLYYLIEKIVTIIRIYLLMCISGWSMAAVRLMWEIALILVSGQAMAAGEAWDGKLEVQDYTTRFMALAEDWM